MSHFIIILHEILAFGIKSVLISYILETSEKPKEIPKCILFANGKSLTKIINVVSTVLSSYPKIVYIHFFLVRTHFVRTVRLRL